MLYKTTDDELWRINKGDWVSSKYYDKDTLVKLIRRRNLIFVFSFVVYLIISAALIMF